MKNTVKSNFSLRKLILTALVAGPVAILPAPLWALPSTAATNLTTSTGVQVVTAGTALNITSPDKGILTWVNFGSGGDTIAAGDTLNYILPSSSASVLNLVSGGASTTINGALVSNGNVYLMNPAGIVIGSGATVNTGGFYASAINEPLAASSFASTGTLSFVGTGTGTVTVSHTNAASTAPVLQALGTGNNIVLAGGTTGTAVDVKMGSVFGNLTTRTTGGDIALASAGPVSVSGGLTVTSNGGAVDLSKAGTVATYTGAALATLPAPVAGSLPTATNLITTGGAGYAPNATVAITFDAPKVALTGGGSTFNQVVYGTAATGQYVTNSAGQITSFTILTGGSGYTAAPAYTALPTPASQTLTVGGALNVTTAGGAIRNDSGNLVTVTGATSLNTAGANNAFGTVTLPNVDFSTLNLTSVGKTTVTDSVGGITLGNGSVTASDASATQLSITSSASSSNISMASGAKITVNPTATNLTPGITLNGSKGSVSYTGVGAMTFTQITTSTTNSATISGDKDITIAAVSTRGLTVTTSGGSITTAGVGGSSTTTATIKLATTGLGDITYNSNNLFTSGAVDIQASNGKVTVGTGVAATTSMNVGSGSIIKATGDVSITAPLAAPSGVTIQSTAGNVSLGGSFSGNGTISAASNVTFAAVDGNTSKADISGGTITMNGLNSQGNGNGSILSYALSSTSLKLGAGYNPNSNYDLTFTGGGGAGAAGYATTDSAGRIASVTITNPGTGYTTLPTSINVTSSGANLPSNSIVANGALSVTAGSGALTIPGAIVSTSTSELSLQSSQTLTIGANITAPTLKLTSTGSNISQTAGTIVSTSKATISAATNASLDTTQYVVGASTVANSNNFNQVVVTNTPGGATISDGNGIVIGGGTDAKGDLVVKAGLIASNQTVTLSSPVTQYTTATLGATTNTNAVPTTNTVAGSVTGLTVPTSTGYAPNAAVTVTFTAPPAPVAPTAITAYSAAASTSTATTGSVLGGGGVVKVNIQYPVGNGYAPNSQVPVTFLQKNAGAIVGGGNADGYTVTPTGYATVNGNGQISGVVITNPGSGATNAGGNVQEITFASPTAVGAWNGGMTNTPADTASGQLIADSTGKLATLVLTNPGTGYFGSYVPTASFTAAGGTTATAAGVAGGAANAATVSVNVTGGGSNYASAPTVTLSNGATATATIDAVTRQVNSIIPTATGTIALGTAATDVIKVAGNLSLNTSAPQGTVNLGLSSQADNAVVSTVANSITVTGTISASNNGAAVTFGNAAPIGTTTAYSFGGVGASIATGNLTVNSNGALALGAITANSLTAKTLTGDITNTGALTLANGATLTAKDIFAPGNITLNNAGNAIDGTIIVTNAKDFTLTNTKNTTVQAGLAATVGSAMTGVTSVTTSAGKSLTLNTGAASGGDYGVISFNAGGSVTVNDPNGVTIRNATNSGNGTVTINAAGPINLDSGITLGSSGLTTFNATGATGTITDTAAGISVYGPATFNSSNNISITKAGHSFGAVTLSSGVANPAATSSDIVYTESGTANLAGVTAGNNGSVAITSTTGGIIQSAGSISLTGALTATQQTATFTGATGVALSRTGNSFGGVVPVAVTLTGGADSAISANTALTLGNVRVSGGTFTVDTTTSALGGAAVIQAAGTTAAIFGNTSVTTRGSAITLTNSGNNYGALTLSSVGGAGAAAGADVALTEGGTLNLNSANAGTGGKIALTSENGNIIQTATGTGLTGGTTALTAAISLTAAKGSITLGGTNNSNGAPITISTTGSATLVDTATASTKLASGTTVGGTTTLRNTSGTATLSDVSGGILLTGAVLVDMTGAAATGNIQITGSGNSFGAFQFRAANVTIAEDKTLNIAAGSLATGTANLSSLADIITTGAGSSIFSGPTTSLTLSAGGNITITNPIAVANGLTFRALGAVDLSALSMANLNGKTPTNLGAASYKAPQP